MTATRSLGNTSVRSKASAPTTRASTGRLPFGLKRIDYSKPHPKWPIPPDPPAPKNLVKRAFPYFQLGLALALFGTVVLYRDDSVIEYWRAVEQGNVPVFGEGEDDDDDDDEDFDDNDDEDEWGDDENENKDNAEKSTISSVSSS